MYLDISRVCQYDATLSRGAPPACTTDEHNLTNTGFELSSSPRQPAPIANMESENNNDSLICKNATATSSVSCFTQSPEGREYRGGPEKFSRMEVVGNGLARCQISPADSVENNAAGLTVRDDVKCSCPVNKRYDKFVKNVESLSRERDQGDGRELCGKSDCAVDYRKVNDLLANDASASEKIGSKAEPNKSDDSLMHDTDDDVYFNKCEICVKNETVLASRLDGYVVASGERMTFYKCHLCGDVGRIWTSLSRLQRHMAVHCRTDCAAPENSSELRQQKHTDCYDCKVSSDSSCTIRQNPCVDSDAERYLKKTNSDCDLPSVSRSYKENTLTKPSGVVCSKFDQNSNHLVLDSQLKGLNYSKDETELKDDISSNNLAYGEHYDRAKWSTPSQHVADLNNFVHKRKHRKRLHNAVSLSEIPKPGQRLPVVTSSMLANSNSFVKTSMGDENYASYCKARQRISDLFDQESPTGRLVSSYAKSNTVTSSCDSETRMSASQSSPTILGSFPSALLKSNSASELGMSTSKTGRKNSITKRSNSDFCGSPVVRSSSDDASLQCVTRGTPSTSPVSTSDKTNQHPSTVALPGSAMSFVTPLGFESMSPGCGGTMPMPFHPLLLSPSLVQGFSGLMCSPQMMSSILSTQPGAAGGFLSNPLAYYAHLSSSLMAMNSAASAFGSSATRPCSDESNDAGVRDCTMEDDSPQDLAGDGEAEWGRCLSSSTSGSSYSSAKCSSLSRTHSRLDVVHQPIRREDACKSIVMPDGRTAYRCQYCKKDFCTMSDVNRHMDFHEDIRPYKCRFCNYFARTNSQLKVHMMRHQGIREFMCHLCSYKGVTQSDLNRHTKSQIHRMKARNECCQCREGFVSSVNLEQHCREKHSFTPQPSPRQASDSTSSLVT